MKTRQSLLILLLACLVALSWANPLKDLARTTIDVSETQTSKSSERFGVTVQRVDNIIDDNGEVIAAKAMAVIINFDVRDDQVIVNNVPIRLGVTSVEIIQAEIMASDVNETEAAAIEHTFNVTLATVEVSSTIEAFATSDPTVTLRRVTIRIRVIEVDGDEVVQTDAVERILELKVNNPSIHDLAGSKSSNSFADGDSKMKHHHHKHHRSSCFKNLRRRIKHWWNCSSRFVRVTIVSSGLAAVFGLCFLAAPAAYRRIRGYERVAVEEELPQLQKVDQVIYIADDEKRALMQRDDEQQQQQ